MKFDDLQSWFTNRIGVLATMHRKERVIAPILKTELGINVVTPPDFNTDKFGTFTRDIKRIGTQIEAARLKAQKALEITGETIAIASEGSFYPYPSCPFISCDREIVLFLDTQHNLEVIGQEISTQTNHSHQSVQTVEDALNFAQKFGFPEHGLVVMLNKNSTESEEIVKGIISSDKLIKTVESFLNKSPHKTIHLETDMRAMYNPTRMKAIEKATLNLIEKINHLCPRCSFPGFDIIERRSGLPCQLCQAPTSLIYADIYRCKSCHFKKQVLFPNGVKFADPTYCEYCNP